MTDKVRIRIAAGVTAIFLAAISAAGLAVRHDSAQSGAAGPPVALPTTPDAAAGSAQPVLSSRYDDEDEDEGYDDE